MCRKARFDNSRHGSVNEIQGLFTFWVLKNFLRHLQNTSTLKNTNKPNHTNKSNSKSNHLFLPTLRSFQHNLDHELVFMTQ